MSDPRVTIKIPRPIYERVQGLIEESGFSSATDFIVYVLRDLLSERSLREDGAAPPQAELTRAEILAVRKRLKSLGYLD